MGVCKVICICIVLMRPMYIYAILQVKDVTEKTLEVSPYNTLAYGVLVTVLILAVVFIWREYRRIQERYRDHVEKTVGLVQVVESKLDTIEELDQETSDIKAEINGLENKIGKLSEHINLLRGNESN